MGSSDVEDKVSGDVIGDFDVLRFFVRKSLIQRQREGFKSIVIKFAWVDGLKAEQKSTLRGLKVRYSAPAFQNIPLLPV